MIKYGVFLDYLKQPNGILEHSKSKIFLGPLSGPQTPCRANDIFILSCHKMIWFRSRALNSEQYEPITNFLPLFTLSLFVEFT